MPRSRPSDRQLSGSGRDSLEGDGKRRLAQLERPEILDELLGRDVTTLVMREEIERPLIVFLAFEQNTEVCVADVAEH
jgi:hypothetical protein